VPGSGAARSHHQQRGHAQELLHARGLAPGVGVEPREDRLDLAQHPVEAEGVGAIQAGQRVDADRPVGIQHIQQDQAALVDAGNAGAHGLDQVAAVVALAIQQQIT
jgi:hypothetical protein